MKTHMFILSTILVLSCAHTQVHAAASDKTSGIQWLLTAITGRKHTVTAPMPPARSTSLSEYQKSKQLWSVMHKQMLRISDSRMQSDISSLLCSEGRDTYDNLTDRKAYERARQDPAARQRFEQQANIIATRLVDKFKGRKIHYLPTNTHAYLTVDPKGRITGTTLNTNATGSIADERAIPLLMWTCMSITAYQTEFQESATFLKELMIPENATFFKQLDEEVFPNCVPKETVAELQARIVAQQQRAFDAISAKYPDFYQRALAQQKQ